MEERKEAEQATVAVLETAGGVKERVGGEVYLQVGLEAEAAKVEAAKAQGAKAAGGARVRVEVEVRAVTAATGCSACTPRTQGRRLAAPPPLGRLTQQTPRSLRISVGTGCSRLGLLAAAEWVGAAATAVVAAHSARMARTQYIRPVRGRH